MFLHCVQLQWEGHWFSRLTANIWAASFVNLLPQSWSKKWFYFYHVIKPLMCSGSLKVTSVFWRPSVRCQPALLGSSVAANVPCVKTTAVYPMHDRKRHKNGAVEWCTGTAVQLHSLTGYTKRQTHISHCFMENDLDRPGETLDCSVWLSPCDHLLIC